MKIARYEHQGNVSYGFVVDGTVVDHRAVAGVTAGSVRELVAGGDLPAAADGAAAAPGVPLEEVTLLPPVELGKVVCAGVNFASHRVEGGRAADKPDHPTIFTRSPDSHVGHDVPILKPADARTFDYEGELAVVVGRRAWHTGEESALDHVFGYTAYNDGSVREYQTHSGQWVPGKNFYRSGSIGPFLVTADEVEDIGDAWLTTRVNGAERQRAQIKDMIFSVAELIDYTTRWTPLEPGDVIAAGTPGGVGHWMDPKVYLVPGDVVEVEIEGVGVLRNVVTEDEDATTSSAALALAAAR